MPDPLTRPEWRAGVNKVLGSSFTPYTPALTASTTDPSGWTCEGRWVQVGPLVVVKFRLLAGSSVTAGTGTYRVGLPVSANDLMVAGVGTVVLYDASSGGSYLAEARPDAATYVVLSYPGTWGGTWTTATAAAPWTWAVDDQIRGTIMYEAAAL